METINTIHHRNTPPPPPLPPPSPPPLPSICYLDASLFLLKLVISFYTLIMNIYRIQICSEDFFKLQFVNQMQCKQMSFRNRISITVWSRALPFLARALPFWLALRRFGSRFEVLAHTLTFWLTVGHFGSYLDKTKKHTPIKSNFSIIQTFTIFFLWERHRGVYQGASGASMDAPGVGL